jgi:hypothetical protein
MGQIQDMGSSKINESEFAKILLKETIYEKAD